MNDPYAILGLSPGATMEEVKSAYKLYTLKLHPDRHNGDPFFDEMTKRVNQAYKVICDAAESGRDIYVNVPEDGEEPDTEKLKKRIRQMELQYNLLHALERLQAERLELCQKEKEAAERSYQACLKWVTALAIGWILALCL